jgi:RNA polymerase sigma factor (sigma-70 family)
MAMEEASIRESLAALVRRMTTNETLQQDLLQEALIHLWLVETRRPGQTRSWYVQSCRFHLQHYLGAGSSVDSAKRRNGEIQFLPGTDDEEELLEQGDSGNSVLTWVSVREIMSLLARHVTPQEKAVLDCLADGLSAREIGRELGLSHTMVIRHRRKIAALLTSFGIPAEPQRNGKPINGKVRANGHRPRPAKSVFG